MAYSCVRIERAANGFSVCVNDPKIVKQNQKDGKYRDPERKYVFKTAKEVSTFITDNMDKMLPTEDDDPSFDAAFDRAAKAAEKG